MTVGKDTFVSIIVNNYNYEKFLTKSIDSAINQTYPYKEVIVVDDGSTDSSASIIKSYGNYVVAVFKKNGGQASAFNEGFKISKGEILLFLDSDDFLLPYALEKILEAWQTSCAKIHYRLKTVDSDEKSIGTYPPRNTKLSDGDTLVTLLGKSSYITSVTSGNAYNRSVLEKIFPIPENEFKIAADGYLNTLVPLYGQVKSIDKILGVYRIHGENLWAFTDKKPLPEIIDAMIEHDVKRYRFLAKEAGKLGYFVSEKSLLQDYKHIRLRLISLGLTDKQPPRIGERLAFASIGIKSLLKYSFEMSLVGKFELITKFVLLGFLPPPLIRLLSNKL